MGELEASLPDELKSGCLRLAGGKRVHDAECRNRECGMRNKKTEPNGRSKFQQIQAVWFFKV